MREQPPAPDLVRSGVGLRIYAEDPVLQIPQPGRVFELSPERSWDASPASAELHLGVAEGDELAADSCGIIGELYAFAPVEIHGASGTRSGASEALALAQGAMAETWISGSLWTNQQYLLELIQHPWVKEGMFHAGFLDEDFVPSLGPSTEMIQRIAQIAALPESQGGLDSAANRYKWVVAGKIVPPQWLEKPELGETPWIKAPTFFKVGAQTGLSGALKLSDGTTQRICAYPITADRWKIRFGTWETLFKRIPLAEAGIRRITSLSPGEIHSVLYREGP